MIEKIKKSIVDEYNNTSLSAKLFLLWLLEPYYMTVARFVFHRLGLSDSIIGTVLLIIVSFIPVLAFAVNIKKFDKKYYMPGIVLVLSVIVIFLLTIFIHPEYMRFFTKPGYGIERILRPDSALYAFVFVVLIDKSEEVINIIKKYAVLDFIYMVIVDIIPRLTKGYFEDISSYGEMVQRPYSLSFGYAMLFPTIVFIYALTKKFNVLYLIGAAIGAISIFQFGNRGAWLLIWGYVAVMIITRCIHSEKYVNLKKIIIILCTIVGVGVAAFGIPKVVGSVMINIAEQKEEEGKEIEVSRTAEFASEGKIADGTGRDYIWGAVIDAIKDASKEGKVFGYGLYGDRPFVEPNHYAGYSHNIALELISNFGILGILFLLKLIIDGIRMVFLCKDENYREIYVITFVTSCQLLLSMSFWYVIEFWIMLGVSYSYIHRDGNIKTLGRIIKNKAVSKKEVSHE